MERLKLTLTTAIFFLPFCAFAHGQEVLVPIFIQLISILAFVVFLVSSKINISKRLLLGATYFFTLGLIVLLSWNVPYGRNRTILDLSMTLGPAITTLVAFLFLRFRKRSTAQ
jgi:hypothetical protein